MRLLHRLSLPGAQQYEMRYIECEFSDSDLPPALVNDLKPREVWQLLQWLVQRECLISAVTSGFMDGQQALNASETLKVAFLKDGLAEKVKAYGL